MPTWILILLAVAAWLVVVCAGLIPLLRWIWRTDAEAPKPPKRRE